MQLVLLIFSITHVILPCPASVWSYVPRNAAAARTEAQLLEPFAQLHALMDLPMQQLAI